MAPPPLASLPDGGRRPRDSATIPEALGKASGAPRAPPGLPPPYPLPSILEPGKEATQSLPLVQATRKPLTAGVIQERGHRDTLQPRHVSRKTAFDCGKTYYSARVQDGDEL